ncbi:YcjX family protein [Shewanella corallii]|uniref:YcjX family protein n=1 Tax=Shewanella corallii TaxID=560080 RepID=A0ABT0NBI4_9GAMM|nr:YcjX family protein [Shewanella corallii]MCL2915809.1 YcjX family protein [Shewanella corallii]
MAKIRNAFESLSRQSKQLVKRGADRHLRLAVTGLSGAGKTAFITGLVHQLTSEQVGKHLPLWQVCRSDRLVGVRREMQPDLDIASFDLQGALNSLEATPPLWPASTRNISELRLAIRYRPVQGLLGKMTDSATLYLDIIDYPGEWLLDLPMLKLDFGTWCRQQSLRAGVLASSPEYPAFLKALKSIDLEAEANEQQLREVAELYRALLLDLVMNQGFYQAQPGRMLLPGDLEGTPLLTFFPILSSDVSQFERLEQSAKSSAYQVLKLRYQEYVSKVVKPFYRHHFAHFDRQLVLVDCLTALNRGRAQFDDMTAALSSVLDSFQFGKSNLLRRLFAPRIDKLLIAASKADHVTMDQQSNLLHLLGDVLKQSRHAAHFDGCQVETMAISAIRATTSGSVSEQGEMRQVIQGHALESGDLLTLFPGEVPRYLPKPDYWESRGFEFTAFRPANKPESGMQHLRLDHLLEYMLGDKMR